MPDQVGLSGAAYILGVREQTLLEWLKPNSGNFPPDNTYFIPPRRVEGGSRQRPVWVKSDVERFAAQVGSKIGAGWLYAIVAPEVKRVKIGRATDPEERLRRDFQCGSPVELYVHSRTFHADVKQAESAAHTSLAHARVRGEWFDMTDPNVVRWLAERDGHRHIDPQLH